MGWVKGFEPSLSRATTWRLRPLGDTHHRRTTARAASSKCTTTGGLRRSGSSRWPSVAATGSARQHVERRVEGAPLQAEAHPQRRAVAARIACEHTERYAAGHVLARASEQVGDAIERAAPAIAMIEGERRAGAALLDRRQDGVGWRSDDRARNAQQREQRAVARGVACIPSSGALSTPPGPRPPNTAALPPVRSWPCASPTIVARYWSVSSGSARSQFAPCACTSCCTQPIPALYEASALRTSPSNASR